MSSISLLLPKIILILCLLQVTACSSIGYLFHTSSNHLKLMSQRQSIEKVIEDDDLDAGTKSSLQDVIRLREFASNELLLPRNKSYTSYVALGRDSVTWVVFAAESYSLQAKTWCFLIVGCVPYRGYFDYSKAEEFSVQLQQQGYETYIASVPAYSTLGWFSDPILSSMLNHGHLSTAEYIFHELAHQKLYLKNDSSFNEAFATAVGQIGVSRWLQSEGDEERLTRYLESNERKQEIYRLVGELRLGLAEVYNSTEHVKNRQVQKSQVILHYKNLMTDKLKSWGSYSQYKQWLLDDINNAKLNAFSTYREMVPSFLSLYQRCDGSLIRFYSALERLENLDKQARIQQLKNQHC